MTRTVVIVQARYSSTRLPGKILNELAGKTVLERVLSRCLGIRGIDDVCCAIPDSPDCDVVVAEAERIGVTVSRGSERDVLARYYKAATEMEADVILRVTSDCPLIDPEICEDVLSLRAREDASYASNNNPPSWPHGLDCEAFPYVWLKRAADEATSEFDREHVCPFIRNHPDGRIANLLSPAPDMKRHRWTLDTPEDMAFFKAIWRHMPEGPDAWDYRIPLAIVEANPDIAAINASLANRNSSK